MLSNVHVFGKSDGLREALEERFQRAGASIVEDPSDSELVVGIDQQEEISILRLFLWAQILRNQRLF
ncbi:MAG: hypothetical protein Ct9H90mP24_8540 [Methanobacteriota archaeon]|nr:MAG: hypothetical protein Ct9H90mP24_8540 [Euryarchaeota archaeon]